MQLFSRGRGNGLDMAFKRVGRRRSQSFPSEGHCEDMSCRFVRADNLRRRQAFSEDPADDKSRPGSAPVYSWMSDGPSDGSDKIHGFRESHSYCDILFNRDQTDDVPDRRHFLNTYIGNCCCQYAAESDHLNCSHQETCHLSGSRSVTL